MSIRRQVALRGALLALLVWWCQPALVGAWQASAKVRRPSAMVSVDQWLWITHQHTGSISVVDRQSLTQINEIADVGGRLVDVAASESGQWLVALDNARAQLVFLERHGSDARVSHRLSACRDAQRIAWNHRARRAAVTGRWSRRIVFYRVERDDQWIETGQLELPFAPRELVFVGESMLIVTDAYGGNLAVVDIDQGMRVVHHVNGHNLYGLSVSPQQDRIVFNMQRLNSFRPTTYEDIFWGGVMQNIMVELMLRDVLRPPGEEGLNESVYFLGRPSEGTGDPTALLLSADGVAVIALGGVHQVAIRPTPYAPLEYRAVGKRPIALARPGDGRTVYVLCQMDDSLHELNLDTLQVTRSLNLSPDVQPDLAAQGEAFFYDATLALDGWFSCHSCHSDGHTNGLLNDNFGDDSQGAPKRVPSLLGTADTGPWGWTGRMQTLEDQVRKSLTRTMHGGRADETVVAAITAYLRTLPAVTGAEQYSTYQSRNDGPTSNNAGPISTTDRTDRLISTTDGPISNNESLSKNTRFFHGDETALRRGAALFERHGCSDCHQPPNFTSAATYDVGLHDEVGNKLFNPPSLRGLFLRDTFFHDSRATSLRDVFLKYKHPSEISWSNEDLDDLLTYLKSL